MAKLTSAQRKHLRSSQFAEPGKRKYPLDTRSRAKNALARVSQHGTESEKRMIRKKVSAKYPGIKVSGMKGKSKKRDNAARKRVSVKA